MIRNCKLETRVYAVEPTDKLSWERINTLSKATFQKKAEEQGHVWSLNYFLTQLNIFQVDACYNTITTPRKLVFRTYNVRRY